MYAVQRFEIVVNNQAIPVYLVDAIENSHALFAYEAGYHARPSLGIPQTTVIDAQGSIDDLIDEFVHKANPMLELKLPGFPDNDLTKMFASAMLTMLSKMHLVDTDKIILYQKERYIYDGVFMISGTNYKRRVFSESG
ncbi:hypothetical protein C4573_05460 [Candidatus Woesearchaeota archaeon]|nr:MAG: hypothetical protein C4573_05460 [Candidatus Woesearchaeota archaeon]